MGQQEGRGPQGQGHHRSRSLGDGGARGSMTAHPRQCWLPGRGRGTGTAASRAGEHRGRPGGAGAAPGRTDTPPPPPPPGPAARRARSAPTRTHLRATTAGARPASCRAGSVQFGPVRSPPRAAAPRATGTESAEPQRDAPAGPASRFFLIGYGAAGLPGYCALL